MQKKHVKNTIFAKKNKSFVIRKCVENINVTIK